ncbi:MAG: mucin desulfatase, partial [Marinilabiliales bacterium]
ENGENRFEEIRLYPAKENSYHHVDEEGNYWRVMNYVKDSHSVDVVETAEQAYEAAKAYAYFQRHLANLPTEGFIETIPDFHSLSWRLQQYDEALQKDAAGRAQSCQAELEFVEQHRHFADKLEALLESGDIPIRITHNDTKINNVLFNNTTRKGIAVVDLDTIMPGSVLYDFGDMMRTFLSPAAEDEHDLSKVIFRQEIFEALHKGYMEELGDILTDGEKEHLRFGGKIMTFIIGLRFLTDHLNGDVYFKVAREGHNLDRCRVQFRLLELM